MLRGLMLVLSKDMDNIIVHMDSEVALNAVQSPWRVLKLGPKNQKCHRFFYMDNIIVHMESKLP